MISIHGIRKLDYKKYDQVWAVVRSMSYQNPHIAQMSILSPPPALFHKYLEWRDLGMWNHETFLNKYVPEFLQYIHDNKDANQMLGTLSRMSEKLHICLTCFCPDETLCHRSILAGLLQGLGCKVETETGNDYTAYFKYYLENISRPS